MIIENIKVSKGDKTFDITGSQLSNMKHTVGFDERNITGIKHRKFVARRNYFHTNKNFYLDDLVNQGLMRCKQCGSGWSGTHNYHLTELGRSVLSEIVGARIYVS